MKPIEYYENESENGSYQYVPLSKIIEDFEFETTDDDSILKNTRRVKIIKHAKDAVRELNKSTFNEEKVMEITVPENLSIILPHDFVNIKRVSVIVMDDNSNSLKLLPINRNNNINIAKGVLQAHTGDLLFDSEGYVLNTNGSNAYAKPHKTYQFVQNLSNYQKFGEYIIDKNRGKILFSSDLYNMDVVIQYRSDGLAKDTYGEDEIRVHKDMVQVVKDLMYYTLIRFRQHVPQNEKQSALMRFKTTRHEARLDKLPLLIDILRGGRNPKNGLTSYSGSPRVNPPNNGNAVTPPTELPTADAGIDKEITLPTNSVSLIGEGNLNYAGVKSYLWTVPNGVSISNPNISNPVVSNLPQGEHTITLTITYSDNVTATDSVLITVNADLSPPDTEKPSEPTNLQTSVLNNVITLTWDASTDNVGVVEYDVEYTLTSDSSWSNSTVVTTPNLTYDFTLTPESYKFSVRARDLAGNNSFYSSAVNATIV